MNKLFKSFLLLFFVFSLIAPVFATEPNIEINPGFQAKIEKVLKELTPEQKAKLKKQIQKNLKKYPWLGPLAKKWVGKPKFDKKYVAKKKPFDVNKFAKKVKAFKHIWKRMPQKSKERIVDGVLDEAAKVYSKYYAPKKKFKAHRFVIQTENGPVTVELEVVNKGKKSILRKKILI